jgi:hypothetical protein
VLLQVGGHARQREHGGHFHEFTRDVERRQQVHLPDAERLAHDLVRIRLDTHGHAGQRRELGRQRRKSDGQLKGGGHCGPQARVRRRP